MAHTYRFFQYQISLKPFLYYWLAYEQGVLSAQATFTEFQRRGVFDEHLDWSDIEADVEKEQQNRADMAALAGSAFGDDNEDGKGDNKGDEGKEE